MLCREFSDFQPNRLPRESELAMAKIGPTGTAREIDAVFCSRDLRVVKVVRNLRPWRTAAARGAKVVIELPAGAADPFEK